MSFEKEVATCALILAGGKGTRLGSITKTLPKTLVPLCGVPMLEYQISLLVKAGIKVIILFLNYLSGTVKEEIPVWCNKYGVVIKYFVEDTELGTAGPLELASDVISSVIDNENSPILLFNCDVFLDIDLKNFVATAQRHYLHHQTLVTIGATKVKDVRRFGVLETQGEVVTGFFEKPKNMGNDRLVNAGIYVVRLPFIKKIRKGKSELNDYFSDLLKTKGQITYFHFPGFWFDMGTPTTYLEAQKTCLKKKAVEEGSIFSGRGTHNVLNNVFVDNSASVKTSATLNNCAVFKNVTIGSNAVVENAIVNSGVVIPDNARFVGTPTTAIIVDQPFTNPSLSTSPQPSLVGTPPLD